MNAPRAKELFAIPWAKPSLGPKEKSYLIEAIESTWISTGPFLERFEEEFPRRIGSPYGVAVSSGTAALQLAVMALGLKPDDEVIVPGFSFATVANVVMAAAARPVYADIDPHTWCIDPASVAQKITPRTKAIIAVHLFGNMCAMTELMQMAGRHGIVVIEDAAESALSSLSGRYAGSIGDIGCFSFQATKTLTMGEGGCVVSSRASVIDHIRSLRDHGMNKTKRYWHDTPGLNFRLTNLQAALGCAQLHRADEIVSRRRQIDAIYRRLLAGVEEISLQRLTPGVDPVIWTVAVRLKTSSSRSRQDVMEFLARHGIETRPGFYPFSDMPLYEAPVLTHVSAIAPEILLLPSFTDLTDGEIERVCEQLKKAVR